MKQETLEEGFDRIYNSMDFTEFDFASFKLGTKWQQENIPIKILDVDNIYAHIENGVVIIEKNDKDKRMYSEEEVLAIIFQKRMPYMTDTEIIEWFEQFKKK